MFDIVCCKCGKPKHSSDYKIIDGRYYPICLCCILTWVAKGNKPISDSIPKKITK